MLVREAQIIFSHIISTDSMHNSVNETLHWKSDQFKADEGTKGTNIILNVFTVTV